ncbi:hypothetical protein J7L60_08070 [Candidatus Bathyarchaeota archaeon]|nr:hypothetical protein [Candidatus Bathyarchaeota archaeon]
MFKLFGRQRKRLSLKEIRAGLNSLCVNLIRYSEMRRLRLASEEELNLRLEMSLSDLKDLKALTEDLGNDNPYPETLIHSLQVIRAYAIVAGVEGEPFIEENYERILRSARWCLSEIEKTQPPSRTEA